MHETAKRLEIEMQKVWKILPMVAGAILGWMVFNPPEFLEALGPLKSVLWLVLLVGLFIAFVAWNINSNLPHQLSINSEPGASFSSEGNAFVHELQELGFSPITEAPLRIGVAPPALLVPLLHQSEALYATVFQTTTVPAKTSFDVVSLFDGVDGSLTTSREGGNMPASEGELRQIFPGQRPRFLLDKHREALHFLAASGIRSRPATSADFEPSFRASFSKTRREFLKNPLAFTLVTLWRTVTKRIPHVGGLAAQTTAKKQVRQLAIGRTG